MEETTNGETTKKKRKKKKKKINRMLEVKLRGDYMKPFASFYDAKALDMAYSP